MSVCKGPVRGLVYLPVRNRAKRDSLKGLPVIFSYKPIEYQIAARTAVIAGKTLIMVSTVRLAAITSRVFLNAVITTLLISV